MSASARPPLGAGVLLAVAAGGALGSLARWSVAQAFPSEARAFPWATLAVNLSGAFLLGALMVLLLERRAGGRYLRPFLAVGLLGGYTTFSAYALELRNLLAVGEPAVAAAYAVASLVGCVAAVGSGATLVRAASPQRPVPASPRPGPRP